MRLLMISGANLATGGGDAVHTLEMAAGLARAGVLVTLVLRGKYCGPGVRGVRTVSLPVSGSKFLSLLLWPVMACAAALYLATVRRQDAVYIRESIYELPAVIMLKALGLPVLLEINAVLAEDLRSGGRAGWKVSLARRAQRKAILAADLVLPVTASLARWLKGLGVPADRVMVVANGANPYLYHPFKRKEALAGIGLDPARRYFCLVGNLAPWQGAGLLIEAFGRLAGYYHDTALLVVGDGREREALEKQVGRLGLRGRVLFTGRQPYGRVPYFIGACLAGIGAGWWGDNLSVKNRFLHSGSSALKVYSYLACGLPVVVPDIPDLAGVVRREGCGLVVKPDRVEELEGALRAILENPRHWREAGLKGRAYIEREATWDHRASQVAAAAARLAGGPGCRPG